MKRKFFVLMLVCLLIAAIPVSAAVTPYASNNAYSHDYSLYREWYRPWNWSDCVLSYLIAHEDGTYTRVEASDENTVEEADRRVAVETYSADYAISAQTLLPFELPIFGGFYEGEDYYFLVFGQTNPDESDAQEVVRVVRYTKQWQRVDALSICGANTYIPFDAGNLRMVESGGVLYIHTCHEMYASSDGLHHQANMTFAVRISDMTLTDSRYGVSNIGRGYSSHSFNQFIALDGNNLITVDHGDAYPRSVVMCRYTAAAGSERFSNKTISNINVLPIQGATGDNYTGVQVGDLEVSDSHYLVVGTSIVQDDTYGTTEVQNVFLTATPKDDFTEAATTLTWFTDEAADSSVLVSNPYLVRINGNKYLLMWGEDETLCYQFVDGAGKPLGEVSTMNAKLSDCQPVVAGERVVWYVTGGSTPQFYAIDLSGGTHIHTYQAVVTLPGCLSQGYTTYTCTCGDSYVADYTDPAGHSWGEWYVGIEPGCETYGRMMADCTRDGCYYYSYYRISPTGHSYVDGTCTGCGAADPDYVAPLFDLVGSNVALGNDLTMNFFVSKSYISETDYIEIVKEYGDGTSVTTTIPYADLADYFGVYWQVSLKGMAAKEMADKIEVTVYNADGVAISNTWTDSIRDYCVRQLDKANMADAYTLLADMLNYGAAAQTQFSYNTDDLANSTMTAAQAAYATQDFNLGDYSNNMVKGDNFIGSSLSLETNIILSMYFGKLVSTNGLTAIVTYTDHTGVAQTLTITEDKFVTLAGVYYGVVVDTLVASDVRQIVTLEVYDGDTLVASGADSMEGYAVRQGGDMNIALMKFTLSAYAYIHRNDA